MTDNVKNELAGLRLRSQADVHHMWELLMRPLGFASTSLWVSFVDRRGAPIPTLMEITELDDVPSRTDVSMLFDVLRRVVDDAPEIAGVAFLISRPGRGGLLPSDRVVAGRLLAEAEVAGMRCEPVHVANDVTVLGVAPDDLAA
jgi:hypothetical protein